MEKFLLYLFLSLLLACSSDMVINTNTNTTPDTNPIPDATPEDMQNFIDYSEKVKFRFNSRLNVDWLKYKCPRTFKDGVEDVNGIDIDKYGVFCSLNGIDKDHQGISYNYYGYQYKAIEKLNEDREERRKIKSMAFFEEKINAIEYFLLEAKYEGEGVNGTNYSLIRRHDEWYYRAYVTGTMSEEDYISKSKNLYTLRAEKFAEYDAILDEVRTILQSQ